MALVKLGALVSSVAGSVGGATFTRVREGVSVQRNGGGRVGVRGRSTTASRMFGAISGFWAALPLETRAAWSTAAGGDGLGQALFCRVVSLRARVHGGWDFRVPERQAVEVPGVVSVASSAAAQSLVVTWSARPAPGTTDVAVWYCVFRSAGSRSPGFRWRGPFGVAMAEDGSVDVGPGLFALQDVCQPGRVIGIRVAFFRSLAGKMSGPIEARCVVTA
jgi:hypothetical protein